MKKIVECGVLIVACLAIFACGRKDSPKPPEFFAPSRVLYPTARGELDAVVLRWALPKTDARGQALRDLAGFVIRRARVEQGKAPNFETLTYLSNDAVPKAAIDAKDAAQLSFVEYKDKDVEVGVRYQYQIFGVNEEGVEGIASNTIVVIFGGTSSSVQIL